LMDRTEPDQLGNLKELRRILSLVDLDLVAVWLSGDGVDRLREIERAELILAMPYARAAAHTVAHRLGVPVVDVGLPVGLTATREMLTLVGEAVGRRAQAAAAAEAESAAALASTQRHIGAFIQGNRLVVGLGDPHLTQAIETLGADVGLEVVVSQQSDRAVEPLARMMAEETNVPRLMVLSQARACSRDVFPFGYPNWLEHPIAEQPFLGFAGFVSLVDRLARAFAQQSVPRRFSD
jgi:nitrogenase molybdenum-iron protein alpha/beta subunit